MRKITLFDDEKIVHKIKYANKTTIMYFLFVILASATFNYFYTRDYSVIAFLVMFFIFVPLLFTFTFNIYRRLFQRIYITNKRIIIAYGYLLRFYRIFNISDINAVFYKAKKFDNINKASSIRIIFNNKKKYTFKKIKYGPNIAKLLSAHIEKTNEMIEKEKAKLIKKQNKINRKNINK